METKQLHQFLTQWINKAVQNGGFNAQEARDALGALDALAQKTMVEPEAATKEPAKKGGSKK
jgi:hypothetical protein